MWSRTSMIFDPTCLYESYDITVQTGQALQVSSSISPYLVEDYAWSNKEFEEFPTSFVSSKSSYFIRLHLTPEFSSGNIILLL